MSLKGARFRIVKAANLNLVSQVSAFQVHTTRTTTKKKKKTKPIVDETTFKLSSWVKQNGFSSFAPPPRRHETLLARLHRLVHEARAPGSVAGHGRGEDVAQHTGGVHSHHS